MGSPVHRVYRANTMAAKSSATKQRRTASARARTLDDVGEFALIERIERKARRSSGTAVALGIGDDAALLRTTRGFDLAVSADSLVEDVHFDRSQMSARDTGRRALAVNLSDLAAMGARPIGFTLALQAPATLELRWLDGMVTGLLDEARAHAAPLVGGNLARGLETALAITVLGEVERGRALRRDGLRPGDRLFVTGALGGAALALARAQQTGAPLRHRVTPRLEAGRRLVSLGRCSACIDLSDGLVADLGHVLDASGVGAQIEASSVPRARGLAAGARRLSLDPDRLALAGGEDYELLFGLRPGRNRSENPSEAVLGRRLRTSVTEIGVVTAARGIHGLPQLAGYQHF